MLDATQRAMAIYKAMVAKIPQANLAKMSGNPASPDPAGKTEYDVMYQNILSIFGQADLGYILTNAVVQPGTMLTPAGALVSTTGSPAAQTGSVTTNQNIQGTGKIT